jgi:hypothetical protein
VKNELERCHGTPEEGRTWMKEGRKSFVKRDRRRSFVAR